MFSEPPARGCVPVIRHFRWKTPEMAARTLEAVNAREGSGNDVSPGSGRGGIKGAAATRSLPDSHSAIRMWKLLVAFLLAAEAHGCGVPAYSPIRTGRVVNGEDAIPYSWPWQVSLQYQAGSQFYHTCGGSLIHPNWVMTAGHCIFPDFNYKVVLGEHDLIVEESPEQHIPINPGDIFVHHGWDPSCISCGDDIALIKLSRPAVLNDKVKLGCLPPAGEVLPNYHPCYISGWGSLYTGGPLPALLQQALLPVVDHAHCSQPDWWGSFVKETMVCAGGDIRAGCNGDSGGPLSCPGNDGRWYVHGIASFVSGWGCDTLQKPTVFTRVSAFISWIEQIISSNSP
ncbi:proproteinase E-like [Candoia aspera]|uniref:proproteinase E-like n=1 Tax=Candoia aspera TaxID=51853 RepID=UPI002FD8159E